MVVWIKCIQVSILHVLYMHLIPNHPHYENQMILIIQLMGIDGWFRKNGCPKIDGEACINPTIDKDSLKDDLILSHTLVGRSF